MPSASACAIAAPSVARPFVSRHSPRSPRRVRVSYRVVTAGVMIDASSASASSPKPRLVLFGSQGSRSPLVNWYMHELGLPFSVRPPSDSGNPHPFGQIPALVDFTDSSTDAVAADLECVQLWESGAILSYLGDRHGDLDTPKKRANASKWILWANASLDPCLFKENERGQVLDTGARVVGKQEPPKALQRLEKVLAASQSGWLLKEGFGPGDVAVGAYLLYVPQFFRDVSFSRWPKICDYMKRCASRPAYAEAYGDDVAEFLVNKCTEWIE